MKKKAQIMILLLTTALTLLFACRSETGPYGSLGNSNGNISNGGTSVRSSDWIYFMNYADNNALYRINTGSLSEEKISDDQGFYLNIAEDGLIYSNGSDSSFLYRMNLKDMSSERLIEDAASNVIVSDGWVYYINRTDAQSEQDYSRIFRIRSDGSGREKVSQRPAAAFNIRGDEIFYLDLEDQSLNRTRTDGGKTDRILDTPVVYITIFEDQLYYINGEDGENTIWKMNLDGTEHIQLSKDKAAAFNISDGWIYYASTLNETPELEIRRMDQNGNGMITFNDDNAISISIHEDWLMYLSLDFNTFMFTQTFVKTDGTGRKDYKAGGGISQEEIITYEMKEKIATDELTVECVSSYATNILESSDPESDSPIFDEVTDGAYIFLNTIITNDTDAPIDLYQELGILEDLKSEDRTIYWPLLADVTDEENNEESAFSLPREKYSENLSIGPYETRNIQIYLDLYEPEFPIYLGLFSNESLDPGSAFVVNPDEENYVVSWASSMEIMAERFPSAQISQLSGMGYQLPGEKEEHFYYTFAVNEDLSGDLVYYFVRRDDGMIYTGEISEENPDYIAVPVRPLP